MNLKHWPTLLGYGVATVAFIAAAIFAVMYASGTRVDFKNQKLTKTGVLAVITQPPGATIKLDGKPLTRTSPIIMRNVLPGTYTIEAELANYRTYRQTVEIIPGQATEANSIDLFLEELEEKPVASNVLSPINVDNDVWYLGTDKKFYRYSGGASEVQTFDRLPASVRNILNNTTELFLARKHTSSNNMALGVVSGGKRWLAIIDPGGYRGQVFGTPLNEVPAFDVNWLDNDRLLFLNKGDLLTLDLNSSKINTYAKSVNGTFIQEGRVYFVQRDKEGARLMVDNNLFDERVAEIFADDLPLGDQYQVSLMLPEQMFMRIVTGKTAGLWQLIPSIEGDVKTYKQVKLANDIGEVYYFESRKKLVYGRDKKIMAYDLEKEKDEELDSLVSKVQILGKHSDTIFLAMNNKLHAFNILGDTLYELGDSAGASVYMGNDQKRIWVFAKNVISEWTLRRSNGIFNPLTLMRPTNTAVR